MGISRRAAATVVLLAVLLAPVGDWAHVTTGTTEYLWEPGPHVLESPWWFVLLIAGLAMQACLAFAWLEARAPTGPRPPAAAGTVVAAPAVAAVAGVMAIYGASALLRDAPLTVSTVVLVSAAALVWALADATRNGLILGLLVMVAGTGGEIVLPQLGVSRYADDIDTLAGVAPWLPAIHFTFGVAIAGLLRVLGGVAGPAVSAGR